MGWRLGKRGLFFGLSSEVSCFWSGPVVLEIIEIGPLYVVSILLVLSREDCFLSWEKSDQDSTLAPISE